MKRDKLQKIFFEPLIRNAPHGVDLHEWAKQIMDVDNRPISRYTVSKPCKIPGLFMHQDTIPGPDPSRVYRKLIKNDKLFVRSEDRINRITVESGRHVFLVTREEWDSIRPKLLLATGHEEI